MTMRILATVLAGAAALTVAAPVGAMVPIDYTISGQFQGDVYSGGFVLNFDPTINQSDPTQPAAYTFVSGNLTVQVGGAGTATYDHIGVTYLPDPHHLDVYDFLGEFEGIPFYFLFDPNLTSQTPYYLNGAVFDPAPYTGLTVTRDVPEPGAWAMMLLGFGAIGFAMRRRKLAETRTA